MTSRLDEDPSRAHEVRTLTVAPVPAAHVYVRPIASADGSDRVVRLPDPRPTGAPSTSQRWWPPVMPLTAFTSASVPC